MDIQGIVNLKEFFKAVLKCKGDVELVTGDGDKLNLRSTLCQYIAMTQMFDEENNIKWELALSDPDDYDILEPYIVRKQ